MRHWRRTGIPAEYGDRAATVKVTTKSGLESPRSFFGNVSYGASSFEFRYERNRRAIRRIDGGQRMRVFQQPGRLVVGSVARSDQLREPAQQRQQRGLLFKF